MKVKELLMLDLLKKVASKYKKYYPDSNYLSICITEDYIHVNNAYFAEDKEDPLNITQEKEND